MARGLCGGGALHLPLPLSHAALCSRGCLEGGAPWGAHPGGAAALGRGTAFGSVGTVARSVQGRRKARSCGACKDCHLVPGGRKPEQHLEHILLVWLVVWDTRTQTRPSGHVSSCHVFQCHTCFKSHKTLLFYVVKIHVSVPTCLPLKKSRYSFLHF